MGEEAVEISLLKMILDIVMVNIVGWCCFIIDLFAVPYHRGFFCSDQRLMAPLRKSTVPWVPLMITLYLLPMALILVGEFIHRKKDPNQYSLLGLNIPSFLYNFYCNYGIYCFGEATSRLITETVKFCVGRLRPYFITGCAPNVCQGNPDPNKYHQKWKCTKGKFFRSGWRSYDPILSFPSGHSTMAMYGVVFVAIYFQSRLTWDGSKLLRPVAQLLFLGTGLWICLTRLQDHKHHWEDVVAGMTVGTVIAFLYAVHLTKLFKKEND